MKNRILYSILILFLFVNCSKKEEGTQLPYDYTNVEKLDVKEIVAAAQWDVRPVAEGIVWKSYQFNNLFETKQFVTILEVDLSKGFKIELPFVTSGFLKTSVAATDHNALVAFNGSYFNTTSGGSTVFLKKDGKVIKETNNGFNSYRENGALTLNSSGVPNIVVKPSSGWNSINEPTALAGGPLLMIGGKELSQLEVDFNTTRHPRTAVGLTADNRLLIIVVDGRASLSRGMSIPELSSFMAALECVSALNYDGGGSSTAWVKNYGVVNHPSDNGKFDNEGERGVATVFVIKK